MYKAFKNILKSYLSYNQKLLLQLSYNIIRNPKETRHHINRYRFNRAVVRKAVIDFVPPVFSATITDDCNLRCPTCLYLLEQPDKFFPSIISPDKFRQVLEKYNKKRKAEIIFLDGGEPLLHPDFGLLVDICKEYGLSAKTSTNGILIKSRISSLRKLDYVNVSLDAHDYVSYKKYRGGTPKQFDLIIEGLQALKQNGIYFSMSYLLSAENLSETDKMIELAEEIRPNFIYFHNINPHGCDRYNPLTFQDTNTKLFLKKILRQTNYPFDIYISVIFDLNSPLFFDGRCIQPWYYFLFNSVGDVSYCCQVAHNVKIGNVFGSYDLNSQEMVRFREDIIQGKIPKRCLYCQRRFMGKEFATFNSKSKKWFINDKSYQRYD